MSPPGGSTRSPKQRASLEPKQGGHQWSPSNIFPGAKLGQQSSIPLTKTTNTVKDKWQTRDTRPTRSSRPQYNNPQKSNF